MPNGFDLVVAAGQNNLDIRPDDPQLAKRLFSAHNRHGHVQKNDVHAICKPPECIKTLPTVLGQHDLVSEAFQGSPCRASENLLVVYNENGTCSLEGSLLRNPFESCLIFIPAGRKQQLRLLEERQEALSQVRGPLLLTQAEVRRNFEMMGDRSGASMPKPETKKSKATMYEYLWRNKWLTGNAKNIDDMIAGLEDAVKTLKKYKEVGPGLKSDFSGAGDDYIFFRTTDAELAKQLNFEPVED